MDREQLKAYRKRLSDLFEHRNRYRIEEAMEYISFTKIEIAIRMIMDKVPDESIRKYTQLSMIIIEALHYLAEELMMADADAKNKMLRDAMNLTRNQP